METYSFISHFFFQSHIYQDLLCGFPEKQKQLETFRENLKPFQELRWEESWNNTVRKTLYT